MNNKLIEDCKEKDEHQKEREKREKYLLLFQEIQKEKMNKMNKYVFDGVTYDKILKKMNQIPLRLAQEEYKFRLDYDLEEDSFLKENYILKDSIQNTIKLIEDLCLKISPESLNYLKKLKSEEQMEMERRKQKGQANPPQSLKPSSSVLDFINSLEQYIRLDPNPNLPRNKEYYPLKKSQEDGKIQIDIMHPSEKTRILRKIDTIEKLQTKDKEAFTTFTCHQPTRTIFAGTNTGQLHRIEADGNKKDEGKKVGDSVVITAIDCQFDSLVIGYENGNILFFPDINKMTSTTPINDYHQSSVSVVKILNAESKQFELISSEEKGKVLILQGSKGMFSSSYSITKTEMYESEDIIHRIEVLIIPLDSSSMKYERIFALGSLEDINIFRIKPSTTKILTHKKPEGTEGEVPDFCFIKGLSPIPNAVIPNPKSFSSNPKSFSSNQKSYSSKTGSTMSIIDPNKKETFFCLAWGKHIYLYVEKRKTEADLIDRFSLRGQYSHSNSIIRVTPLTDNFLLFVDKAMQVKIIVTVDMKPIDKGSSKSKPSMANPIEKRKLEFSLNLYDFDLFKIRKKSPKLKLSFDLYEYSLIPIDKGLYVFGRNKIVEYKLIAWEKCLGNYIKKDDWNKTLMLSFELFNKKMMLIGETKEEEKKLVANKNNILKNVIGEIIAKIINKEIDQQLKTGFNMLIEFSIETSIQELVLDWIYESITYNKAIANNANDERVLYISQLFDCLEFYILSDQMFEAALSPKIISEMIQYYCKRNYKSRLTQLLLHLNCTTLTEESIMKEIEVNDLIKVYIYIAMNRNEDSSRNDYFQPVIYLYKLYSRKKEMIDYASFIIQREEQLLNNAIQSSKQYIGHHILWYCNLCLNECIFPSFDSGYLIDRSNFELLVVQIVLWLTACCNSMLLLDSSAFFQVYKRAFTESKLFNILSKAQYSKHKEFLSAIGFEGNDVRPLHLIEKVNHECHNIDNFYAYKDFHDCVLSIAVSNKHIAFDCNLLIFSIEFLLSYYENIKNASVEDVYKSHHHSCMANFAEENKKTENNILAILAKLVLTEESIERLIAACDLSLFIEVRLYLLQKTEHYSDCLNAHFMRYNDDMLSSKEVKVKLIFYWIENTLKDLSSNSNAFNSKAKKIEKKMLQEHISIKSQISKQFKLFVKKSKETQSKEGPQSKIQPKPKSRFDRIRDALDFTEEKPYTKLVENMNRAKLLLHVHMLKDYYFQKEGNKYDILFSNFKLSILNSLQRLSEISFDETFALTDQWFDEIQENMLQKLEHLPLLQFRFVNHYLKKNETRSKEDTSEEYNSILRLQIRLLCEINRKNEIINILKANRHICDISLFSLLKDNDVFDAALFLLNTLGAYHEGIELANKALNANTSDILDNLLDEQFKKEQHNRFLIQTQSYFDLGIQLCQCASESSDKSCEDIWLNLINCLYAIIEKLNRYNSQLDNNELTYYYLQAQKKFSEGIDFILSKICEYVKMPVVLDIVTEKCKNVGMKEFKKLFKKALFSFSRMDNILHCARSLLNTTILLTRQRMIRFIGRGKEYLLNACDNCQKLFENADYIKTFYCGHKYHITCTLKEGDNFLCPICLKKENEMIPGRIPKRHLVPVSLENNAQEKEEDFKEDVNVRNEKIMQMKIKEKNNKLANVFSLVRSRLTKLNSTQYDKGLPN